jgi:superfamily I DNA/RNA helicase
VEIISIDSNEKEENKAIEIIGEKFKNTGEKLFVMSRTNEKYKEIQKNYKNKPNNIVFFTFHRSKGLESPHCLLIGDCYYNSKNQFKNLIYELAGMNQSYDESQRDEAMRLAYVALTRGVKKVFWIGEEKDGGALSKLKDLA